MFAIRCYGWLLWVDADWCLQSDAMTHAHLPGGKGHCFVEYEEQGQIELEEFYDFKPSWDAYYAKHGKQPAVAAADDGDSDWEDVDGDDDAGDGMETEGK